MSSTLCRRRRLMSPITILYILGYSAVVLSLLPVAIGLGRRRYFTPTYKAAFVLAACTCLSDLSATILALNGIRNWFMMPVANLLYALPVFWFYHGLVVSKYRKLWLGLALLFIVIQFSEVALFTGISAFTSVSSTYLSVTFIISSVVLLRSTVRKTATVSRQGSTVFISMTKQPLFWLILAILVYYGGSLPNALIGHYLSTQQEGVFYFTTGISSSLLILYRVIFARGIYMIPTTKSLNSFTLSKH